MANHGQVIDWYVLSHVKQRFDLANSSYSNIIENICVFSSRIHSFHVTLDTGIPSVVSWGYISLHFNDRTWATICLRNLSVLVQLCYLRWVKSDSNQLFMFVVASLYSILLMLIVSKFWSLPFIDSSFGHCWYWSLHLNIFIQCNSCSCCHGNMLVLRSWLYCA